MENIKIPLLRFSEFDGQWTENTLGEVTYKVNIVNKESEDLPIYSISNINGFVPQSVQFEGMDSNERGYDISLYKIIENHTYAYNPARINVGSIGYSGTLGRVIVSSLYVCFKTIDAVKDVFFSQYLNTANFKISAIKHGEGGVRIYLFYENFSKISISYPPQIEQLKISSFLTKIDDNILALSRKKNLLEKYKKGIEQKLFSQNLRLKNDNGEAFEDWEFKNGNEIFESISNKNHNSDIPILAITQEHGAIPRNLIDFNISVSDKSVDSYKVVEKGDFIISLRSFQGGIEYSNYKGICSPAYIILRSKIKINDKFFKYYFKTDVYIQHLNRKLEGIRDGKMVSFSYFSEIKLPLPTIQEQTKISDFLTLIDEKIQQTQKQLDGLEYWKRGLLQKMFC